MFSSLNGLEYKYDFSAEKFRTAFEFLKREDLVSLPEGWIDLGSGVRAGIQHYNSFKREDNKFESHDRFFDIQYVIEGEEYCDVCERSLCDMIASPYDESGDYTLYYDPPYYSSVLLTPGSFVVLGPEDVHKPRCMVSVSTPVRKVVIKIPV